MGNKQYKDKTRQKIKARKKQPPQTIPDTDLTESDRIVEAVSKRIERRISERTGVEHKTLRSPLTESMSEALLEYAEPLMDVIDTGNRKEFEKVVKVSIMVWNYAVVLEKEGDGKKAKKMLELIMLSADYKVLVDFMLERKRKLFPNNNRYIMDYEVTVMKDGDFHLTVSSSLE